MDQTQDPFLRNIAEMLHRMETNMNNNTFELSKMNDTMNKNMTDVNETIKHSINEAIAPIAKRQDQYEKKNDQRLDKLEATVASLSALVRPSSSVGPRESSNLQENTDQSTSAPARDSTYTSTSNNSEIMSLIKEARAIVGIGPVFEEDFAYFAKPERHQNVREAALEVLVSN